MKSAFTLPALIAATVHGVLLFAFNEPHQPATTAPSRGADPDTMPRLPMFLVPPPDEEDIVEVKPREARVVDPNLKPRPRDAAADPVTVPLELPRGLPDRILPTDSAFIQNAREFSALNGIVDGRRTATEFDDVIGETFLDDTPRAKLQLPPRYPDAMRRDGRSGRIAVTFVVGRDGRVMTAEAERGAQAEFAAAAVAAVKRWRFEPGRRNGRPVSFRMTVPIVFSLAEQT